MQNFPVWPGKGSAAAVKPRRPALALAMAVLAACCASAAPEQEFDGVDVLLIGLEVRLPPTPGPPRRPKRMQHEPTARHPLCAGLRQIPPVAEPARCVVVRASRGGARGPRTKHAVLRRRATRWSQCPAAIATVPTRPHACTQASARAAPVPAGLHPIRCQPSALSWPGWLCRASWAGAWSMSGGVQPPTSRRLEVATCRGPPMPRCAGRWAGRCCRCGPGTFQSVRLRC